MSRSQRFTHSDRIQNFPTARSQAIIAAGIADPQQLIRNLGFADVRVAHVDTTDGLRLTLSDGAIVHLRPSGNAPELRCYAEADEHVAAQSAVVRALGALK